MTKYALAALFVALLVGLGVLVVCRPSRRFDPDWEG